MALTFEKFAFFFGSPSPLPLLSLREIGSGGRGGGRDSEGDSKCLCPETSLSMRANKK
jgi:hypothetical protein